MLEKMSDFFEARLNGYDEHMMTKIKGHFGSVYMYNHAEGRAVFNVILPRYALKGKKL